MDYLLAATELERSSRKHLPPSSPASSSRNSPTMTVTPAPLYSPAPAHPHDHAARLHHEQQQQQQQQQHYQHQQQHYQHQQQHAMYNQAMSNSNHSGANYNNASNTNVYHQQQEHQQHPPLAYQALQREELTAQSVHEHTQETAPGSVSAATYYPYKDQPTQHQVQKPHAHPPTSVYDNSGPSNISFPQQHPQEFFHGQHPSLPHAVEYGPNSFQHQQQQVPRNHQLASDSSAAASHHALHNHMQQQQQHHMQAQGTAVHSPHVHQPVDHKPQMLHVMPHKSHVAPRSNGDAVSPSSGYARSVQTCTIGESTPTPSILPAPLGPPPSTSLHTPSSTVPSSPASLCPPHLVASSTGHSSGGSLLSPSVCLASAAHLRAARSAASEAILALGVLSSASFNLAPEIIRSTPLAEAPRRGDRVLPGGADTSVAACYMLGGTPDSDLNVVLRAWDLTAPRSSRVKVAEAAYKDKVKELIAGLNERGMRESRAENLAALRVCEVIADILDGHVVRELVSRVSESDREISGLRDQVADLRRQLSTAETAGN